MTQEGELARSAVEQDLFGPRALDDEPAPPAPEKYELRRRLGSGGAGVVYLAEDTSLKRAVALKFLHDASEADVERFRREARFTARLNDPAIVQVYETGGRRSCCSRGPPPTRGGPRHRDCEVP